MKRQGTAKVQINFAERVAVTFRPQLEVSLDCYICRRRHRTVVMKAIGDAGICTPTRHAFPGSLSEVVTVGREGLFTFSYEYEPFTDQKYPDESRYAQWEKGAPSWVRVSFDVTCPSCGLTTVRSTQTNLVRPWDCFCKCGTKLYADQHIPELLWRPHPKTGPGGAPNGGPATPPGNSGVSEGPPSAT